MQKLIAFLRLIRSLNLLFIVLTQCSVQYFIIKPILAQAGAVPTLDELHFILLVAATVLIAAAGYVINDYFDVKVDEVNKPGRIFIDRVITRRAAMLLHQMFTGTGVLLALYVAWHAGNFKLGFIHPIVAAFLWFYSTGYKRKLLLGNLLVAFLTGFVILIVALYEKSLFNPMNAAVQRAAYSTIVIVFAYFIFAFLVSLARELVKDMEDVEGDRSFGSKTVPIAMGVYRTKGLVYGILVFILMLLIYIQWIEISGGDFISALTVFTTVEFPVLVSLYLLRQASTSAQFHSVSSVIKVVMFMGILTMLYFYLLIRG
ncbi:MAG: geranylgeranylglycerol-phosphate geranylgeranyltransferase [Chitinophagales bacterium]|nr:geranylgeranylglycerol-phosphate geranylgeranyltransferase [Bacteroidota bacterium]MBX7140977.1 geranylgeranylglycerol-phosphate geranylgeranyltransferase [Chitinophagales bacterium]